MCPTCGAENPDGFGFCGSCGAALETSMRGEERKIVSVLFVDLVGFTSRADRADPEDVRAILRPYHALLRREIDRWGGTLEKFVGDAAMAVFGAPTVHEDDPERAVRAALRIVEALPDLNEELGLDLEVRAGIDTGEALVTLGANPSAGEAMVAGDVVNIAARLQTSAPAGGIVVGDATHRATANAIVYEELAPVRVKGKAEPVAGWLAIATRSSSGRGLERPATPFVGRQNDLAVLQQSYRRSLRERSLQLVTVTGEPGVGKTRLVTELSAWVDDQPEIVSWRQGRCLPYGEGVTFWALAEIVKAHAGILGSDDPAEARAKLAAVVDAFDEDPGERGWVLAAVGSLIGIESGRALDRSESFAAWRTLLEGMATKRPLVLVIDDLHWADDALLQFLEELLDRFHEGPLLVLCTARPELYERVPSWGGGKRNSSTVGLSPLSDEETARLVAALLKQAVLPAATQRILLEEAGGNPLFAEEFTKMLVDRGTLQRVGGAWTIAEGTDIAVPDSVQAIIAARLDTLAADRKSMLQDASVVGKVFWSGTVASMAGVDEGLIREVMHDLARKELVREARRSTVDGQIEYAFWHTLVRDVAYGQIPRASRVTKHLAAAAWIEDVAGDRVEDVTELLAHHYTSALELAQASGVTDAAPDLQERAGRSLILAGDRVLYLDPPKAERYYRRALELTPEEHREHPVILVKLIATGVLRAEEAEHVFEQAVEEFRARGDLHGAADAMARFAPQVWQMGDVVRALALGREAVAILERDPPGPELANAYARHSFRLVTSGDVPAGLVAANSALELARTLNLPVAVQDALQSRGLARLASGDPDGLEDLREALRLCLELGLVHETNKAYFNLGENVWEREGPVAAIALHRVSIDLWDRRGMGFDDWGMAELCWLLFDAGKWDELLDAGAAVLTFEGETGELRQPGAMALTMRSLVQLHQGRADLAAEAMPQILSRVRGSDPQILVPGLAVCSLILDRRGSSEEAGQLLSELAAACRASPTWTRARFLADVARVSISVGMPEVTRELSEGLEVVATRQRLSLDSAHATLAEADGQLEEAASMHEQAADGWRAYGNAPEEAFSLLARGHCLLDIERDAEARDTLTSARKVFARLGATPYVSEIDALVERASA